MDALRPTLLDATEWTIESLVRRLDDRLLVQARERLRVAYLDTFDWRIHGVGGGLEAVSSGSAIALRWKAGGEAPYTLPVGSMPRLISELPPGFLRERLTPVIEVRSLLQMGASRVGRTPMRILDEQGNVVVRLDLEEIEIVDAGGEPTGASFQRLSLQPVPGQAEAAERLRGALEADGAAVGVEDDLLREAAAAIGRQPGDYSSKPKIALDARQPAVDAMRSILQHLIDTIEVNVAGVIDDVDVEFLHDLRVATRRTRSALSQVKGVLPADATSPFGDEFRWLGSVTGPLRDLDVYLLEMDGFRRQLDVTDGTLQPLQRLLERSRRNELRRVRRALRSARFARLLSEWNAFLEAPMPPEERAPNADRAIAEVAGERILKAYRRMVKKGSKLGDDPPAESLHRLRIDAKKLRYLLEFFHSLYDQAAVTRLVKELKRLQDILGGFNDMEVQQHRLHEFGDRMIDDSSAGSETLFAMGRLADAMEERQEAYRLQFHERFEAFANNDSRGLYRRIFGGRTT